MPATADQKLTLIGIAIVICWAVLMELGRRSDKKLSDGVSELAAAKRREREAQQQRETWERRLRKVRAMVGKRIRNVRMR